MSLQDGALILLVTLGAFTDIQRGKIPNWLTYPVCVFGISLATAEAGWSGLGASLLGFGVGFVPFLGLYLMAGLGGGDVKLMAAVGALMGYPFVLNAMITSVLVGGLIALLLVTWDGQLLAAARYVGGTVVKTFYPGFERPPLEARRNVPFGVAICLGSFLTLIAVWQGHASPAQLVAALVSL